MKQTRRKFSAEFKAKVALAAIKEQETMSELAKRFEINPVMISRWKAEFISNMAAAFKSGNEESTDENDTEKLYAQIDQLKVENDYLKKSLKKVGL
jgi:transposase-like protein